MPLKEFNKEMTLSTYLTVRIKRFFYHQFIRFFRMKDYVFRKFSKAGLLVMMAIASSSIIGLDTHKTMAFQAFSFLLSLLLISLIGSLYFKPKLSLKRILPQFGTVGEQLRYRIRIWNQSRTVQKGLILSETLKQPYPDFETFLHAREPGEEKRNFFDRAASYYRWSWIYFKNKYADIKDTPISTINEEGNEDIFIEIMPLRRGCLEFESVIIKRPDAIGLVNALAAFPARQSMVILPKRYRLPAITLPGTRQYQPRGISLASSVGDSEEFLSLREYRHGDSLRRIHWKTWARTGKPIVKEFQAEYFVRHALIIDTFDSDLFCDRLEEAISLAASFVCSRDDHESLLDLFFVGTEVYCLTSGRGLGTSEHFLETLASIQICRDKSFSLLASSVLQRCSVLSGCICILISWDSDRQVFISNLEKQNIPVLVFLITDDHKPLSTDSLPVSGSIQFHVLNAGRIQEGLQML